MNKAVFLDRDGVINHDPGDYTRHISEFKILEGLFESLKEIQDKGYKLIVITNQGGISKKQYGHKEVNEIHAYFISEAGKHKVEITDIYYCPHHSDFEKCLCRKPGSLLVEKALAKYEIDPAQSYFFGDKQRDVETAENAGVKGIKTECNAPLKKYIGIVK